MEKMSPAEARTKVALLRETADLLRDLLNKVESNLDVVGNAEFDMYAGTANAANIRSSMMDFCHEFPRFYEQINISARALDDTINTLENQ